MVMPMKHRSEGTAVELRPEKGKGLAMLLLTTGMMLLALSVAVGNLKAQDSPRAYGRFCLQGRIFYGKVQGKQVTVLTAAPWLGGVPTGETLTLSKLRYLAPSEPQVILGTAKAYRQAWAGKIPPKTVRWFLKPPGAAAPPAQDVVPPPTLDEVAVECELVIVIGKTLKNAGPQEAEQGIFGYTVGSDIGGLVTSYHRMTGDPENLPEKVLGPGLKICDGFAPFGPFIWRGVDWRNHRGLVRVHHKNGRVEEVTFNTSDLFYPPEKTVSDLSRVLTLHPGDIIYSGALKSVHAKPGDRVTVRLEDIGEFSYRILSPGEAK